MQLKRQVLTFIPILVLICLSSFKQGDKGASPKQLMELENEIFELVNEIRDKKGLVELKNHTLLQEQAKEHSLKMASGSRAFGHRGWDERAEIIFEKVEVAFVAENIGYNLGQKKPAEAIIEGWLDSKDHKRNLLNEEFHITGVGIAQADDGTFYYTQIFGSYLE